jgi:hypothetical protein
MLPNVRVIGAKLAQRFLDLFEGSPSSGDSDLVKFGVNDPLQHSHFGAKLPKVGLFHYL